MGHGGPSSERWLLTYSDMITLLMVFFVVLFSMAQVDMAKYQKLAESLNRAFGGDGNMIIVPIGGSEVGTFESENRRPVMLDMPTISYDTTDVSAELGDAISRAGIAGQVSVRTNIEGVIISLSEDLVFPSGSAELQPKGKAALDNIARILGTMPNAVRVEGHTDDRPTNNPNYPTNWELSTARAVSIVRYLEAKGISPARLSATGMASFQPIASNDTPEERALNRRANLVIIYPIDSQEFKVDLLPELEAMKNPIGSQVQ